MDGGGKLVGGSLPVEASGLSYLRLSAPTILPPSENFFDLPFFSCKLQQQHIQRFETRQSHYVREIVHVQGSRASNTYVWSESLRCDQSLQKICLRHSKPARFLVGLFAYTCWETSQYWSLGSVIVQVDAK